MTLRSTDYAALAQDAYREPILNKPIPINGVEYRAIAFANDSVTGFQATAYEHVNPNGSHEVIFAYRGTEFGREPVQDGAVDSGMVTSGVNGQALESEKFTKQVMESSRSAAEKNHYAVDFGVTGHSLGGTLAEINAYKYGLHGETFNAYGAAGLAMGIPSGGSQIIDNVKATDVVSAASPHFGQVRTYATQEDIDHLQQAGYTSNSTLLTPRNMVGEAKRDGGGAHAIANFAPDQNGNTIMTASNEALARSNEAAISRYRNDVGNARVAISMATGGEEAALAVDGAVVLGHGISQGAAAANHAAHQAYDATKGAVVLGAHATAREAVHIEHQVLDAEQAVQKRAVQVLHSTEHAAEYVGHQVVEGYDATRQRVERAYDATVSAASHGIDATVHAAKVVEQTGARAYNVQVDATSHRIEAMADHVRTAPVHLDHPSHPDHPLYRQSLNAVHRLDAQNGRTPDQHSANLAGAVTVGARAYGLNKVDHVVLSDDGSKAFAVQGELRSPLKQVANGIDTAQAVNTPLAQSTAGWAQAMQQHQQQQVQSQAEPKMQVAQQDQIVPQQSNPVPR